MSKTETERRNRQSENAIAEHMRAKDVAIYCSCGLSSVWYWVKIRKLKAYKISDKITLFKKSEIDAMINDGAV